MIRYDVKETIEAPAADIFPFLANVSTYRQWMNLESAEVASGQMGEGQQWRAETREGGFLIENNAFETNRHVGFKTLEGPFQWTGGFRLDPAEDGTTVVSSYGEITMNGLRRMMEPLMAGQIRKGETAELSKLKTLVEGR